MLTAVQAKQVELLTSQLSSMQSAILQQKESLPQAEKVLNELKIKYHNAMDSLRSKLSTAMGDEASLLEKWRGQRPELPKITSDDKKVRVVLQRCSICHLLLTLVC